MVFHGYVADRIRLEPGDCREALRGLSDCSIDSVVTDPPYALVSIGKRFGKPGAAPAGYGRDGAYARAARGFMGQTWDTGETAFSANFWAEVLRVLKPGGHCVVFGGTRTYHRLAVAIEDAGFEIRDQLGWMYGTGFPKSHSPGKQFDKALGWFDETEIERGELSITGAMLEDRGTAVKPGWEPIVLARKPLIGTVLENVLADGTGAINIGGCRLPPSGERPPVVSDRRSGNVVYGDGLQGSRCAGMTDLGRFPANVLHDGSPEVAAALGLYSPDAIRFFYAAKASAWDRAGSAHPTVKPVNLLRWLVRLVTPPGGLVLDPFAGSGTTGTAAYLEGMRCFLVEREAPYQADIQRRLEELCAAVRPGWA